MALHGRGFPIKPHVGKFSIQLLAPAPSVGTSSGVAVASAVGVALTVATGSSVGLAAALGIGTAFTMGVGTAVGTSSDAAVGVAIANAIGSVVGTASGAFIGVSIASAIASASGLGGSNFIGIDANAIPAFGPGESKTVELPVFTQCISQETITVAGTAIGFTVSKFKNRASPAIGQDARIAMVTVDGTSGTNDIRFTLDTTPPVGTTTGHLFRAGANDVLIIKGLGNITNFLAIREGGTSATVHVSYFV